MAERDLYAELGLKKGANKDEIKKAYRKLARELHPDRNPNNPRAEERFKRVAYANDVLSDDRKRGLYDEFGEVGLREGFDADAARAMRGRARTGGPVGGGGFGFEEIFAGGARGRRSGFGGTLEDLFGGGIDELFGRGGPPGGFGGRTTTGVPSKTPDQESEIGVSFDEAYHGVERELTITENGRQRTIRVRIPAGVEDGGKVRLRGQGIQSGTPTAGDLVLTVSVGPHKWFRREGADLHLEVPVTFGEAWHGASVKVPTLAGEVALKLPARVQSGAKLRLKGKGMPKRGGGHGDLFAHVEIRVPDGHDHGRIERAVADIESQYTSDVRGHWRG